MGEKRTLPEMLRLRTGIVFTLLTTCVLLFLKKGVYVGLRVARVFCVVFLQCFPPLMHSERLRIIFPTSPSPFPV